MASCGICKRELRPGDEKPVTAATDCGGDCYDCVSKCEWTDEKPECPNGKEHNVTIAHEVAGGNRWLCLVCWLRMEMTDLSSEQVDTMGV